MGGGPAGTSAAITCARAGLSVTLVEAEPFPRHRPGETLHPGVEPLLKRLGAAASLDGANFLRHAGVWVNRSEGSEFHAYGSDENGPWLGYQAIRSEFDALLLTQARSCGVDVLQPHRALQVLRNGERTTGALTTAGEVRTTFTIDASGSSAWLARKLSLPRRSVSQRLIAFYGYVQGDCPARSAEPSFTSLADGWEWIARVRPANSWGGPSRVSDLVVATSRVQWYTSGRTRAIHSQPSASDVKHGSALLAGQSPCT